VRNVSPHIFILCEKCVRPLKLFSVRNVYPPFSQDICCRDSGKIGQPTFRLHCWDLVASNVSEERLAGGGGIEEHFPEPILLSAIAVQCNSLSSAVTVQYNSQDLYISSAITVTMILQYTKPRNLRQLLFTIIPQYTEPM
jgi:hypothetical protein